MIAMKIVETASALPRKVISNEDLEQFVDTSDEWISKRTGIKQRYVALEESCISLAQAAAQNLVNKANISPNEIGLIIVASMSQEHSSPSVASQVQAKIGATKAVCFDISAACSGFVQAFSLADKLEAYYQNGYAIVIGAEKMTNLMNWKDRSTCVLFGDAAGAILVQANGHSAIIQESLACDGSQGAAIIAGGTSLAQFVSPDSYYQDPSLKMKGRQVYDFATRQVPKQIEAVLKSANLTINDIDYFVLHQANARILKVCQRKLKIPEERMVQNIQNYGNTSAASVALVLNDLRKSGALKLDGSQKVLLSAFGGGLTWGTCIVNC